MISKVKLFLLYGLRLYFSEGFAWRPIAIAHTIGDVLAALKFCRVSTQRKGLVRKFWRRAMIADKRDVGDDKEFGF